MLLKNHLESAYIKRKVELLLGDEIKKTISNRDLVHYVNKALDASEKGFKGFVSRLFDSQNKLTLERYCTGLANVIIQANTALLKDSQAAGESNTVITFQNEEKKSPKKTDPAQKDEPAHRNNADNIIDAIVKQILLELTKKGISTIDEGYVLAYVSFHGGLGKSKVLINYSDDAISSLAQKIADTKKNLEEDFPQGVKKFFVLKDEEKESFGKNVKAHLSSLELEDQFSVHQMMEQHKSQPQSLYCRFYIRMKVEQFLKERGLPKAKVNVIFIGAILSYFALDTEENSLFKTKKELDEFCIKLFNHINIGTSNQPVDKLASIVAITIKLSDLLNTNSKPKLTSQALFDIAEYSLQGRTGVFQKQDSLNKLCQEIDNTISKVRGAYKGQCTFEDYKNYVELSREPAVEKLFNIFLIAFIAATSFILLLAFPVAWPFSNLFFQIGLPSIFLIVGTLGFIFSRPNGSIRPILSFLTFASAVGIATFMFFVPTVSLLSGGIMATVGVIGVSLYLQKRDSKNHEMQRPYVGFGLFIAFNIATFVCINVFLPLMPQLTFLLAIVSITWPLMFRGFATMGIAWNNRKIEKWLLRTCRLLWMTLHKQLRPPLNEVLA